MKAIYKNELSTYFSNMTGWIFCAFMLLFCGLFTMVNNLMTGYQEFEYVFGNMSFIYLIIIPILTMRVMSEERRQKTDQLLYSLPISTTEVILGKYFALLTVLLMPILVMCLYPLILSQFGHLHLITSYAAILGFFFLGVALMSIGLFVSCITESQMLAAGLSFLFLLVNYFLSDLATFVDHTGRTSLIGMAIIIVVVAAILFYMTKNMYISVFLVIAGGIALAIIFKSNPAVFEGLLPNLMKKLSLFDRFYNFMYGTMDITDIVFNISVSVVFVFLSVQSMEKRRWS